MIGHPRIAKLTRNHNVEAFDCGQADLNRFLARHALQNQQSSVSQTYVALVDDQILGFYTLVYGEIAYADAPERLTKGLAHHPVPLMLLARLAISAAHQGQGLGAGLLKDAMLRTLQAADIAGLRAFAAHAKDDQAKSFYEHFHFIPSPTNPLHLLLLLKEIRAALQAQASTHKATSK